MQATLILNPEAGDRSPNKDKAPRLLELLAAGGVQAEIVLTSEEKPADQIAREAVAVGTPLVIAGGGDGTASLIAAELVGAKTALTVLPLGTYNNIARSLNIPMDVEDACRAVTNAPIREIDVGRADDGRLFFEAAGAGLDASLFPAGHAIKEGRWHNFLRALKMAAEYEEKDFTLTFDRPVSEAARGSHRHRRESTRNSLRVRALFVVMANGPYYGSGFTVAPTARLDDGLLTVCVYRRFRKWELLRHFWGISRGKYRYSPKVSTFDAAEIRVETSMPLDVHGDGELFGKTPVSFRAEARALKVKAPRA